MDLSSGPLQGLTVVDLTRVLSGPYCTMVLADLGATVIKVEQPGSGDDSRTFFPFIEGESAYFATVNRGKKSIALDLKSPVDRETLDALLSRADVMVENFRPGVLDKLGLGWSDIEPRYPRLVLASISGFGQTGPYRHKGAYDLIVQAMGGLMSMTGHEGMAPLRPGTSLGDLAAGMFAVAGIQAAIIERQRTGRGSRVDISMLECQLSLLETAFARYCSNGEVPRPIGARHPGASPFDVFAAADGYLAITAGSNHLFSSFVDVLGQPQWLTDPRFVDRVNRIANQAELKVLIEAVLATSTVPQWLERFDAVGIPAGTVNDIVAVLDDPQLRSRGAIVDIERSPGLKAAVTPVLTSTHAYPAKLPPAPRLDEHRQQVLDWIEGTPC